MPFLFDTAITSDKTTVELTEIVLQALSTEAYNVACANKNALRQWILPDAVLCQGHTLTVPSSLGSSGAHSRYDVDILEDQSLHFLVRMISPTLKGSVTGRTSIYIVPSLPKNDEIRTIYAAKAGMHEGLCEVDEGFLESSVLSPLSTICFTRQVSDLSYET